MNNVDTKSIGTDSIEPGPEQKTTPVKARRLAEVEVLRAVAVLLVLGQHVPGNLLFWPSNLGNLISSYAGLWVGVDVFFAISGFVIARSLLPRLAGVTDWAAFTRIAVPFWIARAWRLLPSAWFWLAVPLLLCLVFNRSGIYQTFPANWAMAVAGVLDLANFHMALLFGVKPVGVAFVQWSLSLEEQFYLLLPFAAFFCGRSLFVPLLVIAFAGFFEPNLPIVLMLRLWPVAFGVLLALWAPHQTYRECAPTGLAGSRVARVVLFSVLLAALVSVGVSAQYVVGFYQGPVALLAVILVWIASYDRGYLWQDGWSRRLMEVIAARSYSLYLVHIPVYLAAHEIWFRLHGTVNPSLHQAGAIVGLSVLAVAAVAELNHRLLEKPLREHGKRLAASYNARPALAAA